MPAHTKQKQLALLIDADNTQLSLIRQLMVRAGSYGSLIVRRAYGDWSSPRLQRWRTTLHRYGIVPVHLFNYAKGKNAADLALSIDAVDMLHLGQFDGMCIASSDSDYTLLALRARQEGVRVYGFGERQTPRAFVGACERFIYLDTL